MLGHGHELRLMEELWEITDQKAELPAPLADGFFEQHGPMGIQYEDNRAFRRFFLRGKAIIKRDGEKLGAFTKDVSRQGVGFISPVQLMPMERVQLTLPSAELQLQVSRCCRLDHGCFDCGAKFAI
jgi:hypothetical protein